jgi:hypothetical protein
MEALRYREIVRGQDSLNVLDIGIRRACRASCLAHECWSALAATAGDRSYIQDASSHASHPHNSRLNPRVKSF